MKNVLLFCLLFIIIPSIIITLLVVDNSNKEFKFSKNTTIKVYRTKKDIIEEIPLEEYIVGVVAGEMPVSFHEEALKAQAVAARSYIMYKIIHKNNKKYDVEDTVLNQVYVDDEYLKNKWKTKYNEYKSKVVKAVEDSAYQYITYKGEVADALFFSTSGGYTENSEDIFVSKVHYLKSVKSDWDKISPVFNEVHEYNINDFCKILHIDITNKINIKVLDKTTAGRIKSIMINNKKFTGTEIVKLFNLRSSNFTISITDKVTIITHGYGHGVGMSQYGAEGMAQEGYTYDKILKYYYTDVKIEKIK